MCIFIANTQISKALRQLFVWIFFVAKSNFNVNGYIISFEQLPQQFLWKNFFHIEKIYKKWKQNSVTYTEHYTFWCCNIENFSYGAYTLKWKFCLRWRENMKFFPEVSRKYEYYWCFCVYKTNARIKWWNYVGVDKGNP